MEEKKFLGTDDLAKRWGISVATIRSWRTGHNKRGPAYVRIGRRALYDINTVREYEQNHTKISGV